MAVALEISKKGQSIFIKMEVIPDCTGATLNATANENIRVGSSMHCDTFSSCNKLNEVYSPEQQAYTKTNDAEFLKWLHVMISNAKEMLI